MFEKYLTKTGKISSSQPTEAKTYLNIQKFKKQHGDKYSYDLFEYTSQQDKIPIICPYHGMFYQLIQHHQSGRGCPYCQGNYKKSRQEVIKEFIEVHDNMYSYQQVEYSGNKVLVDIICPLHGVFKQTPHHHLLGKGCPDCQSSATTLYLLYSAKADLYKIGVTRNIKQRLQQLGDKSLVVVQTAIAINPRYHEKLLHNRYQQYRKSCYTVTSGNTEFFQLTAEQVQEVIDYFNSVQQGEF